MSQNLHPGQRDPDLALLAPVALVLGVMMVVTALAAVVEIPHWASDYGIMVVVASVLYLIGAGGLMYWAIDQLRNRSDEA
ncbi:phage holin family protein [Nocardia sp. NBC_01730]|uniref:phage holin family protein n=1 Tax=Nocardia sp. NBC_01730 TaxID=2975998 RepID=UPI002E128CEC|nr:phage holin family protein [Nocardia sp. NBC_01730]